MGVFAYEPISPPGSIHPHTAKELHQVGHRFLREERLVEAACLSRLTSLHSLEHEHAHNTKLFSNSFNRLSSLILGRIATTKSSRSTMWSLRKMTQMFPRTRKWSGMLAGLRFPGCLCQHNCRVDVDTKLLSCLHLSLCLG